MKSAARWNASWQNEVPFGSSSAARTEATDASDLDFCVIVETGAEIRGASRALYRNGPFCAMAVDILWSTEASFQEAISVGGVGALIQREGRILYQREAA